MKSVRRLSPLAFLVPTLLVACFSAGVASAQNLKEKITNWDNLKTLRLGQEICAVANDAKSYQGKLRSLRDDGITLRQAAGDQTLARQDILRVSSKVQKHRGRNALIGAAAGAGAGLGIGAAADLSQRNCGSGSFGPCFHNLGKEVLTPLGALAGAAMGAIMPTGGWHEIYRAL